MQRVVKYRGSKVRERPPVYHAFLPMHRRLLHRVDGIY